MAAAGTVDAVGDVHKRVLSSIIPSDQRTDLVSRQMEYVGPHGTKHASLSVNATLHNTSTGVDRHGKLMFVSF